MRTAEARKALMQAGFALATRIPVTDHFDNEIVLYWPHIGAVGVLVERGEAVDASEVEAFLANAAKARA